MPGLVISIGGKLDKSYSSALNQAAIAAREQQRKMENIRSIAPSQLDIVNRALAKLPAESLMRPRLESMKATLTDAMGTAGGQAAGGFMARFMARMKGVGSSGASQLISVFSNTLSSLGAGISPARIFAQQAPNFIQAFTLMGTNAMSMLGKILFNPATWIAGGAIAAGGLFYYISYRAKKAAEDISAIGQSFSHNLGPMEKMISLLEQASKKSKEIADSNREFQRWLNENQNPLTPAKSAAEAKSKQDAARKDAIEQQKKLTAAMEKTKTADQGFSEATADAKRYDAAIKANQQAIDDYNKKFEQRRVLNSKFEWVLPTGVNIEQPMIEVDGKKVPLDQLQNMLNQSIQKSKFNEAEKARQEAIVADLKAGVSEAQKKSDFYGNQFKTTSGSAPARQVSERERIGALNGSQTVQISMLEIQKKNHQLHLQQVAAANRLEKILQEGL